MKLIKTVQEVKDLVVNCQRPLGFVPTMGALHAGHISLIKASVAECKTTLGSIFVNPLQFGPTEDFKIYPRDLQSDLRKCEENNVTVVFAPDENEIYPDLNYVERISPPKFLAEDLCGRTRKNFFYGIATVVKRLFDIVNPDIAYFGEKDLQQLYVIKWLVDEYKYNILVRPCSVVREKNGLACSSRNNYLTIEQKEIASNLYKSLHLARKNIKSGIFSPDQAVLESLVFLSRFSEIKVEYLEIRDKNDLKKASSGKTSRIYLLIAAKIGGVRLIDNIEI